MNSRSLVAIAMALLLTQPASATTDLNGRITMIQSYAGHNGLLVALDTYNAAEGCPGQLWYIFPDDSPRAQWVQSVLLTAQANKRPVGLTIQGCFQNYPKIVNVTSISS